MKENKTIYLKITLLNNVYPFSINIQPILPGIKDVLFSPFIEFENSISSLYDQSIIKKGSIVSIPSIKFYFKKNENS